MEEIKYSIDHLERSGKFILLRKLSYDDIVPFVFQNIKIKTPLILIYWFSCAIFLMIAIYVRVSISGMYDQPSPLIHTLIGLILLPVISIPVHEFLHIIPYYLMGARDIRVGMDLKQMMFYVTAHRFVASQRVFRIVAAFPWLLISIALLIMIHSVPPLWKWSLSLTLFFHATMCAGDFALLNFYIINGKKRIYTWDDADKKESYFYQEV